MRRDARVRATARHATGAVLLVVAFALTGCLPIPTFGIPEPVLTAPPPDGGTSEVAADAGGRFDCEGRTVNVSGADLDFTLVGVCPKVRVTGAELDVDLARAEVDDLLISGDRNDVDAPDLGALAIEGQDNDVDARAIGTLDIAGDRNEVDAGDIGLVAVNGDDNEVTGGAIGLVEEHGRRNIIQSR